MSAYYLPMYYNQLVLRYEVDDFEGKVLEMYKELEPLYKQLHAYVRRRLHSKYGSVSKLLVLNVVIILLWCSYQETSERIALLFTGRC